MVKLKARKLSHVSFERVRDELFKILERPNAFEYLIRNKDNLRKKISDGLPSVIQKANSANENIDKAVISNENIILKI
jgi:tRNA nucleotidyltransferase/poly(A) polymerase